MYEGDQAVNPPARRLVDEPDAAGAQLGQGVENVVDQDADVVHAFSAPGEKPRRAALAVGGSEKLDRAAAGVQKGDFHPVIGGVEPLDQPEAQDSAVCCEGFVNVLHDDADMVDVGVGQGGGFTQD